MQKEDWGKYSQEPWMTGGAWKDTDHKHSPKKMKTKQFTPAPTPDPASTPSSDRSSLDETNFRAEVDLADLQIKLRQWNFARSWKTASSNSLADDSALSPRCLHSDLDIPPQCPDIPALSALQAEKSDTALPYQAVNPTTELTPTLDKALIAQYLDQCIAATESQLARSRNNAKKKGEAVKEIERLVEKVVMQVGLRE